MDFLEKMLAFAGFESRRPDQNKSSRIPIDHNLTFDVSERFERFWRIGPFPDFAVFCCWLPIRTHFRTRGLTVSPTRGTPVDSNRLVRMAQVSLARQW